MNSRLVRLLLLAAIGAGVLLGVTGLLAQTPQAFTELPKPGQTVFTSYQGPAAVVETASATVSGLEALWMFDNRSQSWQGYFPLLPSFARGGGFTLRTGQPVVLVGAAGSAAQQPPTVAPQAEVSCGVERWAVKTLSDPDAVRVSFTPVPASVTQLRAIPAPAYSQPTRASPLWSSPSTR